MSAALLQRVTKLWAIPNSNPNMPGPLVYHSKWGYDRARCPVVDCLYDGLLHPNGYAQHYRLMHDPSLSYQRARRVVNALTPYK